MSILNMTYHGYYTPHDRTTEAIAQAVNHTWNNLEKLAKRVNKIEGDKDATIQQLRDELAAVTERAERAEREMRLQMRQADKATKERDEALARCKRYEETCADMQRQRDEVKHEYRTWLSGLTNHWIYQGDGSDYLESLNVPVLILPDVLLKLTKERDDLRAQLNDSTRKLLDDANAFKALGNAVGLPFNTIMQEIKQPGKKLMFVNNEALAKVAELEQPRMVMRDNGQLWEVFKGDDNSLATGTEMYCHHTDWHKKYKNEILCRGTLYRRPLTADELRSWLPQQPDAKLIEVASVFAVREELRGNDPSIYYVQSDDRSFETYSEDDANWLCAALNRLAQQQPSEVLFGGELSFELDMLHRLGLGKVPLHTPVHAVITRKAGA